MEVDCRGDFLPRWMVQKEICSPLVMTSTTSRGGEKLQKC